MSELYYPGFEITNLNWLKYALLYKEDLYTIIPEYVENRTMSLMYNYIYIMKPIY